MRVARQIGKEEIIIEYGKLARQADVSLLLRYGQTVVLSTLVSAVQEELQEFLPLIVDYQEKAYAVGRIPGGFIKREGKPSEHEIIRARLIDRAIRPLLRNNLTIQLQIVNSVLSADEYDVADLLGLIGASCLLTISSNVPYQQPIGAVRITQIKDEFIVNPTYSEIENAQMELVVGGYVDDAGQIQLTLLECTANQVDERTLLKAIDFCGTYLVPLCQMQRELSQKIAKEKKIVCGINIDQSICKAIQQRADEMKVRQAIFIPEKIERAEALQEILNKLREDFADSTSGEMVLIIFKDYVRHLVRQAIINENRRCDGRTPQQIREISCEVGLLPRCHGSALFTRGQTQALVVTTLGTTEDEQIVENIHGRTMKRFMVHYNFPPYSTNEIKPLRAPTRREIGHGALAERSLKKLIPNEEVFSYTIRLVSDILESNGSTSMATVCGGSLSLMDAGVPISTHVAGISIGLVKEENNVVFLTDITGLEDEFGDMDFKVAGTKNGITGIQLDVKIPGLSREQLHRSLWYAKEARMHILSHMQNILPRPRSKLAPSAPRVLTFSIPTYKIKDVIGPNGRAIKGIIDATGVTIDIKDNGRITIYGKDEQTTVQAKEMIEYIISEVEVGGTYVGRVLRITSFGAFVEIMPGKEGLLHISQLADYHVNRVEDIVKVGEEVLVKVLSIDEQNRISLSRKAALHERGIVEDKSTSKK